MASKMCNTCNTIKLLCDFNKSSSTSDGYRYECKTCNAENVKEWRINNRDHVREHGRNYIATNPSAKIGRNIHDRLNRILRRVNYSVRTQEIIGLNMQTYLEWLSYNFENGMCWTNYGQVWQIDLVIPASAYDLTDEKQLLTAFNWKNIRPCLKSANLAKYNFICQFTIVNYSIRVLEFIRKMRQIKLEHFLRNIE